MLRESLRPWRNAGLEFLLDEHGLFAAQDDCAPDMAGTPPVAPSMEAKTGVPFTPGPSPEHATRQSSSQPDSVPPHRRGGATPQPSARHSQQGSPAPRQNVPGTDGNPASPLRHAAQSAPQRNVSPAGLPGQPNRHATGHASAQPAGANRPAVHPTPQPPEEWPALWRQQWAKVRIPSPVVWTYWSLGEDLSGHAHAERGALLRQIIGSLQLPAGSSAFWPVALPVVAPPAPAEQMTQADKEKASAELIAAPEIFLAGLRRIRPRYCITFGSRALKTFAPHAGLSPYTFTQFMGHRLLALPDIDILLADSSPLPAVIAFLRTAVSLRDRSTRGE